MGGGWRVGWSRSCFDEEVGDDDDDLCGGKKSQFAWVGLG